MTNLKNNVKEYYGKILKGTHDLKTNACCSSKSLPAQHKKILAQIDDEIITKFYGCGSPIPPDLSGKTVLDLGSGSGRDVYLVSKLVGPKGQSIGVDMTNEQLLVARRHQKSQAKRFGFKKINTAFKKGYIEDLKSIGIKDNSVDVVISNCVINLSPDKRAVFSEILRVLKPGGELYFADVFSGSRIPDKLRKDPVLYGECLGGAMYVEDFRRLLRSLGISDYRIVKSRKISLGGDKLEEKVGMIDFYSLTVRIFNLTLEDICEDYGQVATYKGTIKESPHVFELDDHHTFIAHKPMLVCGNTAEMVSKTRFAKHFKVEGNKSRHFGPFDCGPAAIKSVEGDLAGGSCC